MQHVLVGLQQEASSYSIFKMKL